METVGSVVAGAVDRGDRPPPPCSRHDLVVVHSLARRFTFTNSQHHHPSFAFAYTTSSTHAAVAATRTMDAEPSQPSVVVASATSSGLSVNLYAVCLPSVLTATQSPARHSQHLGPLHSLNDHGKRVVSEA